MNKFLSFFILAMITISPIYAEQASLTAINDCNHAYKRIITQIKKTEPYSTKLKQNLQDLILLYYQTIMPTYDQDTVERVTNTLNQLMNWQKELSEITYANKVTILVATKLIAKQINETQHKESTSEQPFLSCPMWIKNLRNSLIQKSRNFLFKYLSKTHQDMINDIINEIIYERFVDQEVDDVFKKTQAQKDFTRKSNDINVSNADDYKTPNLRVDDSIATLTQAITTSNFYDEEYKNELIELTNLYDKKLKDFINRAQESILSEQGISSLEQLGIWQNMLTELVKTNNNPKLMQKIKETAEQFSQTIIPQYSKGYLKEIIKFIIPLDSVTPRAFFAHVTLHQAKYVAREKANKLEKALTPSQETPIVKVEQKVGHTDLHKAVTKEDVETCIIRGDDVNALTALNISPLHMAVENERLNVIEALLKNPKINVNLQNKNGNTPLYRAAELGHQEIVMALLAAKANATIKNTLGYLPVDVAKTDEIKALLTIKTKPKKRTK